MTGLTAETATFGALAIAVIGAFASGVIVSGRFLDRALQANEALRLTLDDLVAAFNRRSDLDEERLRVEKERAAQRAERRGSG